jgi:hypothetical protein
LEQKECTRPKQFADYGTRVSFNDLEMAIELVKKREKSLIAHKTVELAINYKGF